MSKIYADGSSEVGTYDAFNRLTTITKVCGVVKTHTYEASRGLLLSESYSDETNNRTYVYNFLAMTVQISDDAKVRNFAYNSFNEIATEEQCKLSCFVPPYLRLITWDPTQPIATRPLAIQKDGTWYTYGWDLTKNICEIFGQNGYIRNTYAYTPFGSVTATGDVNQPIQWSSEYYDNELALVYYNYRHYNPIDGRWINCDPITEQGGWNLYGFVRNRIWLLMDRFGLNTYRPWMPGLVNPISTYDGYGVPTMPYSFNLVYVSSPNEFDIFITWTQILWSYSGIYIKDQTEFTPNQELKKDSKAKCISSIMIIAHGYADDSGHVVILFLGNDSLCESQNDKFEFNTQISQMFRGIKFCNQCKVELRACYLGKSKYLKKRLEKITGCEIVLYSEGVGPLVDK